MSVKTPLASEPPRPGPAARPAGAPAGGAGGGAPGVGGGVGTAWVSEPRAKYSAGALTRFHRVQVVHHHDHRTGLLLGDQVVEDLVDVTLNGPALLVLAPAVQQIEHGILALRAVVVGRRVDVGAAPRAGHRREVTLLAHRPVRHVLHARILGVGGRLRHLDRAVVEARSEIGTGRGIGDHGAVNRQRVVVETDHLRRRGHVPQAVRRLGHVEALPDAHPDLLGVRRGDPEGDPVVGVDARVRRARDVQRAR